MKRAHSYEHCVCIVCALCLHCVCIMLAAETACDMQRAQGASASDRIQTCASCVHHQISAASQILTTMFAIAQCNRRCVAQSICTASTTMCANVQCLSPTTMIMQIKTLRNDDDGDDDEDDDGDDNEDKGGDGLM